jgi:hypothetical protein
VPGALARLSGVIGKDSGILVEVRSATKWGQWLALAEAPHVGAYLLPLVMKAHHFLFPVRVLEEILSAIPQPSHRLWNERRQSPISPSQCSIASGDPSTLEAA